MNAILLGAASLGALVAMITGNPSEQAARASYEPAIQQTTEDPGELKRMTIVDPDTGDTTHVSVISFAD